MGWNVGSSLLSGAVHIWRHELAVPVQLFRRVSVIVNVHCDSPALAQTKQGARELAIVSHCGKNALRANLYKADANPHRHIGRLMLSRIRVCCRSARAA